MDFPAVAVTLILFACISQMRAAVAPKIPSPEFDMKPQMKPEKFTLSITERGTKFDEKIEINKEKDAAYFKVPPHNGNAEADNMYDFKMNITVSRVKKDRVCYISPLPADLPRPNVLSRTLKKVSNLSPTHNIKIMTQQWTVGGIVDKNTLRAEVRDFCGQFSYYRLEPYTLDSVSVVAGDKNNTLSDRVRRQTVAVRPTKKTIATCHGNIPSREECDPGVWKYNCRVKLTKCVYWVVCIRIQTAFTCTVLGGHKYDSIVCCQPYCP